MADKKKRVYLPFVTGVGTAAYSYFHKPDTGQQYSNNKYKGDLILDGDIDMSKAEALALQAAKEEFGDLDFGGSVELKLPWKSGDGHKNEEFHGKVIFHAASKDAPKLVDSKKKTLPAKVLVKSGDRVRFVVALSPWTKTEEVKVRENGKQVTVKETVYGVTAYLNVVQLIEKRNGGGGVDLLDDIDGFDANDVGDDAPFDTDEADGTNGGDF